jgi:deazaflavin-dependent oxidoreductase (nitroreductase family)
MRAMNVVPTAILRGPAHRLMSDSTLLMTFTGRKSGRSYTLPVVYYQDGDQFVLTTDSRWWHNLTGGADVTVRLRGHDEPARAVADPATRDVETVLREMVRRYPRRYSRLAAQHDLPGAERRVVVEITVGQPAPT